MPSIFRGKPKKKSVCSDLTCQRRTAISSGATESDLGVPFGASTILSDFAASGIVISNPELHEFTSRAVDTAALGLAKKHTEEIRESLGEESEFFLRGQVLEPSSIDLNMPSFSSEIVSGERHTGKHCTGFGMAYFAVAMV